MFRSYDNLQADFFFLELTLLTEMFLGIPNANLNKPERLFWPSSDSHVIHSKLDVC
jgi:hypothetical protein